MMFSRRHVAGRIAWTVVVASVLCMVFSASAFAQRRAAAPSGPALQGNSTVRVMTRNMDAGTDLGYLLSVPPDDATAFVVALLTTIAEVEGSNPEARAERLASEIAAAKPDLVGLQEATLWAFTDAAGNQTTYNQLDLLLNALAAAGHPYRVAVVQTLTDILVPVPGVATASYTDRNAILVRADLPPGQLDVQATTTNRFAAKLDIPTPMGPVTEYEGWMTADVKVRGAWFRFVNTHLRSPIPGANWDGTVMLQMWQASELVQAIGSSPFPVILAGDFNSDAEAAGIGPDQTQSAALIGTVCQDAWHALRPSERGFTWGLYLEDLVPPHFVPATPSERIDLLFSRGPAPLSISQTGTEPGGPLNVYASDHVGVVGDFSLQVGMRAVERRK